jgi:hypothetical protein
MPTPPPNPQDDSSYDHAVAHPLAEIFAQRPWADVTAQEIGPAAQVPSMLHPEECRLYYWLARQNRGIGLTVNLGVFAGGSTAHLAQGLAASGRAHHLHGYDRFTASAQARARYLSPGGVPLTGQDHILPLAQRLLAPWRGNITLHRGEIADLHWKGGAVELLVVDAAKSAPLADHIAAQFYPHLIPGRSLLVHQDFLHPQHPWLLVQMLRLSDHFTPLGLVAQECMVFACTRPVDFAALQDARTAELTDAAYLAQIQRARQTYDIIPPAPLREMMAKLRTNPGAREAWALWQG